MQLLRSSMLVNFALRLYFSDAIIQPGYHLIIRPDHLIA